MPCHHDRTVFHGFYSLRAYIPTLSFEREVTLTKDEAARVGQIRAARGRFQDWPKTVLFG